LDLKDIKELIALMRKNELSELEIETEGFRVKLKKGGETIIAHAPPGYAVPPPAAPPAAEEGKPSGREIVSPLVGTFFAGREPGASPFVEVGTAVTEETVVCIIEALKVMNEIKAEMRGVITEVMVENGKPVQFGQPLFRVK
jgi:acetyl-CoA carboxylase biotin carboxyl carrier protein